MILTDQIELLAAEAHRIIDAATSAGVRLRLTGSVAVQLRCPTHGALARRGADTINPARIADLMSRDWGLWRTAGINLDKAQRIAETHDRIGPVERGHVAAQILAIQRAVEAAPKPLAWRMRAKVGDRV